MVPPDVHHNVELVFGIVALHRRKAYLHRLLPAALVQLHDIFHLAAHGDDGVAVHAQNVIDEAVLLPPGLVPRGVAVFSGLRRNAVLYFQHAALVVPCVAQAVHNHHAVRPHGLGGLPHIFLIPFRAVRRIQPGIQIFTRRGGQVAAAGIGAAALALCVDERHLAPVVRQAVGEVQGPQRLPAARYACQRHAQLHFLALHRRE